MTNHGPRRRLSVLVSFWLVLAFSPLPARADDLGARDWKLKIDRPPLAPAVQAGKEIAIPFPANFGGGGEAIFPTTPSSFVVIGKNFFDNDVRQVWDLSTRKLVGSFKGPLGLDEKTVALSPDGLYLAGKAGQRKVEVRLTRNGRVAQTFDTDSPFTDFIDFAAGDRVVFGRLQDRKLQVCDLKTGDKVCDVALVKEAEKETIAFSPSRVYLAAASWMDGTLRIYDLADGRKVAEAPMPRMNGQNIRCFGLCFAPDGTELAGLFEYFGAYRVVSWDAANGKVLADFDLGKEIQRPAFYAAQGIDWFPDKSAWLVLGYAVVDRSAGKKVWTLPFDNQNLKPGPRRFLDDSHALVVTHQPSMTLRTAEIPRDKIAGAVKIVRSGGNAADAALPPLTPADISKAEKVAFVARPAWSVMPKGPAIASPRLTTRPIALKAKSDDIRALLFPGGNSTQVVAVGTPQQFGQPNPTDGQARWVERFDLAGGKTLGKVDLPNVSDPIAVSPDGSALLLRESKGKDRLDVVSAVDGKPVAGWRPYEKESSDAKAVAWATFLDNNRVLTVSTGGTLVLWSLPQCKAVYLAEDAFRGAPSLSPDRTLLAGFEGKSLRMLDAATGGSRGEGALPTGLGPRDEPKAAAFRTDGQEIAAIFPNSILVRWDLKTGKIASQIALTLPAAGTSLEWADNNHVLLDNRLLVDLGTKRVVWEYIGGQVGAGGPDGRHWLIARGIAGQESGRIVSIDCPEPGLEKAEALLADAKAPFVIRPGSTISLKLDLTGPVKNPQAFREALADALIDKLEAYGLKVVDDAPPANRPAPVRISYVRPAGMAGGPDARLVITVREKDTGQTIQFRRIGVPRNIQVIKLVDLVCEMSLVDSIGTVSWMPPQSLPMQPPGFMLRMPAGEIDPEVYLKKLQWDRVKDWATTAGPPYFVARDGREVVRLPGQTDLNAAFAR